jgi:hypothetical protein
MPDIPIARRRRQLVLTLIDLAVGDAVLLAHPFAQVDSATPDGTKRELRISDTRHNFFLANGTTRLCHDRFINSADLGKVKDASHSDR